MINTNLITRITIRIFFTCFLNACLIDCVTHWKVTELGRIEANDDSIFTLQRPYDLAVFLKQDERLDRYNQIKSIIASKDSLSKNSDIKTAHSVTTYQETFYRSDSDCIKAGKPLAKFTFYDKNFIAWKNEIIKFPIDDSSISEADIINSKRSFRIPICDVELPFSLMTFDHLESIQTKDNISMQPETDLLSHLKMESAEFYGFMVSKALDSNASSWVYLTMASDYFRVKGDYENAINCLQRAIYYSSSNVQHLPLLSLSMLLHKLHYLNDSLSVALSILSLNVNNPSTFYNYLGNIYVTLGQLNSSLLWFNKALQVNPQFQEVILKRHAIYCHQKLEIYLEQQHEQLQHKLDELKDYQSLTDELYSITSKIEAEKSSAQRRAFTKKAYEDFIKNSKSTICEWHTRLKNSKLKCRNISEHYSIYFANKYNVKQDFVESDRDTFPFEYHVLDSDMNNHIYETNSHLKGYFNERKVKSVIKTPIAPNYNSDDKDNTENTSQYSNI